MDPAEALDEESKRIYEKLQRDLGKVPEIYRVRADDADSLRLLDSCIFRWPSLVR